MPIRTEWEPQFKAPAVVLHWLPLGAGGNLVRICGGLWERIDARHQKRPPVPLFHSALELKRGGESWFIELAPALNSLPEDRGVVATGPVGAPWAGRFRIFRYELRCWERGLLPDIEFEISEPVILNRDPEVVDRIIALTARAPSLTWGRDELRLGEMWNSNSVISWLLVGAGLEHEEVEPPDGGRAPGWRAGAEAARMVPPRSQGRAPISNR